MNGKADYTELLNHLRDKQFGAVLEENQDEVMTTCVDKGYCSREPKELNHGILTMAFVDMQPLDGVYCNSEAFRKGTLFPNLNKPFFGGKRN